MKLKKAVIFIPSIESGGVERNAIWIANELTARGISVDVTYVRADENQLIKFNNQVSLIQFPNKKYRLINQRISDAINIRKSFNHYLKKQNYDSTIVLSFQSGIAAIGICKKNHIAVICRLSNHPIAAKFEKNLTRKISEWLKPFFYQKADLVIANSNRLATDFSSKIHKHVETVYNPIDFKRIEQLKTESIETELQNEAKEYSGKLLIAVGRLTLQKDYITLIKGVAQSKYKNHLKLWILGEGSERERIEHLIEEENLQNTIRLLGFKSNVYAYMAVTDLYIQTSLYEGCPNALIEASAAGLPAIATNCLSGPSEVLLQGTGGRLVPLGDSQMIGKAIDEYMENPLKYKQMHKKTYAALDRFESPKITAQYIQIMEQVLSIKARPGGTK